jgi:hypothetical protein
VTQVLGTANQPCNGQQQNFQIQNLGQTEHYLNVISDGTATHLLVFMSGIDNQGHAVRISDQLEMANLLSGALFAAGYFPKVVVTVQCVPTTSTYTLTYSGVWATPPPTVGNFLQTQVDKEIYNGFSGDGGFTYPIVPPYGTSAGELVFRFVSGAVTGSTLQVECLRAPGAGTGWASNVTVAETIASNTTQQNFPVSNFPCPEMFLKYVSGGNGSTVYLAYNFQTAGFSASQATPSSAISGAGGGLLPLNGWEDGGIGAGLAAIVWAIVRKRLKQTGAPQQAKA